MKHINKKLLFTALLILIASISYSQGDYFKETSSGEYFWQKSFTGSKQEALEAIYTNLTIRNNVVTELEDKIYFDFESQFLFNPEAFLSGFVTLRAKIRVEFKDSQYRVTILKMQDVRSTTGLELTVDFQSYSKQSKSRFLKAKSALNKELPKLFENLSNQEYNSPW